MTTSITVLVGSLRSGSVNRRLAEAIRDQAPEGVIIELVEGLAALPFYNEAIDTDDVPAVVTALRATVAAAAEALGVAPGDPVRVARPSAFSCAAICR